jgi:hypothetical protein
MEFNEELYHKIHLHLHNQLKGVDKQDFEQALSQNPALVDEIAKHKFAEELVVDTYLLNLKKTAQEVIIQKRKAARGSKWIGGIGLLTIITGLGTYYFFNTTEKTLGPIRSSHHETHRTLPDSAMIVPKNTRQASTISKNKGTTVSQPTQVVDSIPVDLDKIAQREYLKTFEQVPPKVSQAQNTTKDLTDVPTVQKNTNKEPSKPPMKMDTTMPRPKLLFDIIYNATVSEQVTFPVPIQMGKIKILDHTGNLVYESVFNTASEAIWDGSSQTGQLNTNTQLSVLISNAQSQTIGIGNITIIK